MRLGLVALSAMVVLAGCASAPDGVVNKVLSDFGLKDRPEEMNTANQAVFNNMGAVATAEMKRLNTEQQHGDVKFQKDAELRGKYYKEVKVYEAYFPTDVRPLAGSADSSGYNGYIDYQYRMYQSMRKDTAAEAEAETADISTDITGREAFKYTFSQAGAWNGAKGEKKGK